MCTVSWIHRPSGYTLFFNRDELKSRARSLPPEISSAADGTRFVSPLDGERGGTWIATNEWGVTACLLNYQPPRGMPDRAFNHTRGDMALAMADLRDGSGVKPRMLNRDLTDYAPFHLLAVDPAGGVYLHSWDGVHLAAAEGDDIAAPITTSSYRTTAILAARGDRYRRLVKESGEEPSTVVLERFQRWHDPEHGAESVLMFRPDACTHNLCRVNVGNDGIDFYYEPQAWLPPGGESVTIHLPGCFQKHGANHQASR